MIIDNIKIEDVFYWDCPDFCDAYIISCNIDNKPATEEELKWINENKKLVQEEAYKSLI